MYARFLRKLQLHAHAVGVGHQVGIICKQGAINRGPYKFANTSLLKTSPKPLDLQGQG